MTAAVEPDAYEALTGLVAMVDEGKFHRIGFQRNDAGGGCSACAMRREGAWVVGSGKTAGEAIVALYELIKVGT